MTAMKTPLIPLRHSRGFLSGDPFARMREEMDEVFSHYFQPLSLKRKENGEIGEFGMNVSFDVSETDGEIQLIMDAPGVKKEDIDISLSENSVTVSGKREAEKETKEKNFHRIERSFGEFRRSVLLPCDVDADKVEAKLKDGVLTVILPKSQKAKESVKKIAVKA